LLKLPNESSLIICGDFNETYKNVCSFLEKRYIIPYFGSTYKNKKQIDYIIFDNKNIKHKIVKVLTNNISDHNLIKIVLT
jgi:endonuclease/exonuclease/phosphatase family metal-dependent hydrolase